MSATIFDRVDALEKRVADLETMLAAVYRGIERRGGAAVLDAMVMSRLDVAIACKHVHDHAAETRVDKEAKR